MLDMVRSLPYTGVSVFAVSCCAAIACVIPGIIQPFVIPTGAFTWLAMDFLAEPQCGSKSCDVNVIAVADIHYTRYNGLAIEGASLVCGKDSVHLINWRVDSPSFCLCLQTTGAMKGGWYDSIAPRPTELDARQA